jgi:hypothetical protein
MVGFDHRAMLFAAINDEDDDQDDFDGDTDRGRHAVQ